MNEPPLPPELACALYLAPLRRNEHQLANGHPRLDIGVRPGNVLERVFLYRRRLNFALFDPLAQIGNKVLQEIRAVKEIA